MQNGICEAFNGRMRDELLNETIFYDLDHARSTLARWTAAYNQKRPHSALRYLTPAEFAGAFTATGCQDCSKKGRAHASLRTASFYPIATKPLRLAMAALADSGRPVSANTGHSPNCLIAVEHRPLQLLFKPRNRAD
jgi:hypothetical protein